MSHFFKEIAGRAARASDSFRARRDDRGPRKIYFVGWGEKPARGVSYGEAVNMKKRR